MFELVSLIKEHLAPLMLVMARLGGLVIFAPVFGSQVIPVRVKVLLTIAIGLAIYPLLASTHDIAGIMPLSFWMLAPVMGLEIALGCIIGYAASLPLIAAQTGGLLMGQQMGLGFAQIYDPSVGDQADIVGQIIFYLAFASFLVLGGHEAIVAAVLSSFDHIPLGGMTMDSSVLDMLVGMLMAAFEVALRVAAPLLSLIFLQSTAMGFVSKTVPQLNILSLGFPIRILVGTGLIATGLVVMNEVILDHIDEAMATIHEWIALPTTRLNAAAG